MPESGILFVLPLGERNGATTSLLHLAGWYKANGWRPFSSLFASGGEIVADYAKLAETWAIDSSHWCPGGTRTRVLKSIGLGGLAAVAEKEDIRRFAAHCSPGLLYVNSVTRGGRRLVEALDLHLPVVMHVHEMEWFLHRQAGSELPDILSQATRLVACSEAVRMNLVQAHGIGPDQVETVHESIPVGQIAPKRGRAEILQELGFPENALIVISSGILYWGKGADLFVQLAQAVCRRNRHVYFTWIGKSSPEQVMQFEHDVRVTGLQDRVVYAGAASWPADYYAAADVFALTSREDSFPLACLEAAALGKPIVCFADAGGMPEFVEDDCGFVVPYLDVRAMAERVLCLLDAPECRIKMGETARRKVTERHDVSVAGPRIMDIIERTIAGA